LIANIEAGGHPRVDIDQPVGQHALSCPEHLVHLGYTSRGKSLNHHDCIIIPC
jgi:hypothetical protein